MQLTKIQINLFLQDPEEYVATYQKDEIKYLQTEFNCSKEKAIIIAISQVREAISQQQ